MRILKRILKLGAGLIGVVLCFLLLFVATNFTLVKNLPSAMDGSSDAMYIANQKPLQRVIGSGDDSLKLNLAGDGAFVESHKEWSDTGGKSLLIWHKGKLIYEAYAEGISADQRSKSFSMHKSILGLIAATMEADGIIDLDDPVAKYVDAYARHGRENLSIRNMLQHETGLERYSFNPPSLDMLNLLLSDKVEKTAIKAEIVPGEIVFDYSNLGYQVAGAAIRSALLQNRSQTYRQYLSERFWKPVGATDAYLWSETRNGAPRFYAGMQATPRDWLKVGVMLAQNDGSIIPQSAIETVLTPAALNAGYGLGIWLGVPEDGSREYGPSTEITVQSAEPFIVSDTVFFDGFGGQRVYISQKEQLVIVRIGEVLMDWDDTALPNEVATGLGLNKSPN